MGERVRSVSVGEQIATGRTSEVFRFGSTQVIKLLRANTPSDWAELEATFTRAVRSVGIPVPRVDDIVVVDDRHGIVFERIGGPSMWTAMLERPRDIDRLVDEMVALQRSVHATSVPDGLPSRAERMRAKIADVTYLDDGERARAIGMVDDLPSGGAVLHGDLHPGNVLMAADGPVLIDWFDAAVGHPAADVERTIMLLEPHGGTDLRHLPAATPGLLAGVSAAYVRATTDIVGPDPAAWRAVVAAGRLAERTDDSPDGLRARWASNASLAAASISR